MLGSTILSFRVIHRGSPSGLARVEWWRTYLPKFTLFTILYCLALNPFMKRPNWFKRGDLPEPLNKFFIVCHR